MKFFFVAAIVCSVLILAESSKKESQESFEPQSKSCFALKNSPNGPPRCATSPYFSYFQKVCEYSCVKSGKLSTAICIRKTSSLGKFPMCDDLRCVAKKSNGNNDNTVTYEAQSKSCLKKEDNNNVVRRCISAAYIFSSSVCEYSCTQYGPLQMNLCVQAVQVSGLPYCQNLMCYPKENDRNNNNETDSKLKTTESPKSESKGPKADSIPEAEPESAAPGI